MRKKLTLTLALAAVGCICWFGGYVHGHKTSTVTVTQRWETIEEMAKAQPPALQANLLVVAGSHHCGADEELGALLHRYSIEKLKQLIKGSEL